MYPTDSSRHRTQADSLGNGHCALALTSDVRPVTSDACLRKHDPYNTPMHRRINAFLFLLCIGLVATLIFSAQAKRNQRQTDNATTGSPTTSEKVTKR